MKDGVQNDTQNGTAMVPSSKRYKTLTPFRDCYNLWRRQGTKGHATGYRNGAKFETLQVPSQRFEIVSCSDAKLLPNGFDMVQAC